MLPTYPLYTNFSAFAQDEWKVSQRLSLSLGLRWEVNPAPGVTKGLKPVHDSRVQSEYLDAGTAGHAALADHLVQLCTSAGCRIHLHNAPGWETVVRGGGGVFFDTGQQLGSLGFRWAGVLCVDRIGSGGSFPALPEQFLLS